jgi:hypothetical protein
MSESKSDNFLGALELLALVLSLLLVLRRLVLQRLLARVLLQDFQQPTPQERSL